MGPFEVV
jgi:hypothetical protein